jgi:hypothetical protein
MARQSWNNQAVLRHSIKNRSQIFISSSIDEGIQCPRQNMVWYPDSKIEFLTTWTILTIDSPVVVTANIVVELGIANGSEVIIKEGSTSR